MVPLQCRLYNSVVIKSNLQGLDSSANSHLSHNITGNSHDSPSRIVKLTMASFFKYLFRALKAMSASTPPSTAEPGTESYNKLIFPESLTNNQSTPGTWGVNCPGFFLDYAKKCIVDHSSVESIRVTSLSYHKGKSRGRHEFLVVKVEDTEHNQSNFLQIDRCPPEGEELAFPPKPSDNKACTFRLAEDSDVLPATTAMYVFLVS